MFFWDLIYWLKFSIRHRSNCQLKVISIPCLRFFRDLMLLFQMIYSLSEFYRNLRNNLRLSFFNTQRTKGEGVFCVVKCVENWRLDFWFEDTDPTFVRDYTASRDWTPFNWICNYWRSIFLNPRLLKHWFIISLSNLWVIFGADVLSYHIRLVRLFSQKRTNCVPGLLIYLLSLKR